MDHHGNKVGELFYTNCHFLGFIGFCLLGLFKDGDGQSESVVEGKTRTSLSESIGGVSSVEDSSIVQTGHSSDVDVSESTISIPLDEEGDYRVTKKDNLDNFVVK
jgi:hypothetical protein